MQKKPNDFGQKYGKKKHIEKAESINNVTRELEALQEGPKAEIHTHLLKTTLKKYQSLEKTRPWRNTWLLVQ